MVIGMICCVLIVSLSLFILRQKPGMTLRHNNKATALHCQHVPLHSMPHRRAGGGGGGPHRQVKISTQKMHHQQQLPYNHQSLSNGSTLHSQHAPTSVSGKILDEKRNGSTPQFYVSSPTPISHQPSATYVKNNNISHEQHMAGDNKVRLKNGQMNAVKSRNNGSRKAYV